MNMNFAKFPTPVLSDDTQALYSKLYGEDGERFVDILNTSPDEISVISRLIAYLTERKGAPENGYAENRKGNRPV